jgi:glucose dehydrogenase
MNSERYLSVSVLSNDNTIIMYMMRTQNLLLLLLSQVTFFCCLLFSNLSFGQIEFFSTKISFPESQSGKLYSAITLSGNHVLFNAQDYKVYAYNKQTGAVEWEFYANRKANDPPFVYGNKVIAGIYENEEAKTVQLDLATGKILQTLDIGPLLTTPVFIKDIMYGTALHNSGKLFAYDLKQNKAIWEQFIAHGVETQPYFFKNKIVANAEDSNWFDMNYEGIFLQTGCLVKAQIFVENIKCIRRFNFLTHDDRDITESFIEKYFGVDAEIIEKHTDNTTFITDGNKLMVIGDNKIILKQIDLDQRSVPKLTYLRHFKIIKFDDDKIWIMLEGILTGYNIKSGKVFKKYDLSKWQPHQVVIDVNKIWLVSKKDGQLYGLM